MKKVIYTSLTNGWDDLPQYPALSPDWDYICFTNDFPAGFRQGQWLVRPIPYCHKNPKHMSRYAKMLPHKVLGDYDVSLWIDANLIVDDADFYTQLDAAVQTGVGWQGVSHPAFDCLYDDALECLRYGLAPAVRTLWQMLGYKLRGYPAHQGLFENNLILRSHNNPEIKEIGEAWWRRFLHGVGRDQLSLFYIFWQKGFTPSYIFGKGIHPHNHPCMTYRMHTAHFTFRQKVKRKWRMSVYDMLVKTRLIDAPPAEEE